MELLSLSVHHLLYYNGYYFTIWVNPLNRCMSTIADPCSAPLVGHRSSVIRVLQTRVVATQENICGTGVNRKKRQDYLLVRVAYPRVFDHILVNLCSNVTFRQRMRLLQGASGHAFTAALGQSCAASLGSVLICLSPRRLTIVTQAEKGTIGCEVVE